MGLVLGRIGLCWSQYPRSVSAYRFRGCLSHYFYPSSTTIIFPNCEQSMMDFSHRSPSVRRRFHPYHRPEYKEPQIKQTEDAVVVSRVNRYFDKKSENAVNVRNGVHELEILIEILIIYALCSLFFHVLNILKTLRD
ncbi:hypothetical protein E1B28_003339 [Marasmius oreades]|uniref:Uncharacterized protein n=1 Tax=Marasmius oreades TaxID=181124 RepID=A0A9P7RLD7_9AGAR|nr:uncharacterized protein E1B28_003339 [Marasmius oreades]KAG7085799.1 hypothetical protein E1B28_003339 [Marasmius oreades]